MKNEIEQVLQFDKWRRFPEVIHGMSTRLGGVSKGIYESLNMGWSLGDEETKVKQNYLIFAKKLGIPAESYTFSDQVHRAEIAVVGKSDCGNGFVFPKKNELKGIDGLITNERGLALTIFSADCVPLIFYDPVKTVIAAAHSGWRGTVADIAGQMIEKMIFLFDSHPKDIWIGIGPCISKEHFEVGEDVKKEFEKNGKYDILNEIFQRKQDGKYLLDLRRYIAFGLREKGILREHMEISVECTYGQEDLFFSHRRNGLKRGSHIMVIYLKDNK